MISNIDDYPTLDNALDALAWNLMGIDSDEKLSVRAVRAALINRALGDGHEADPKKGINKLLAKKVGRVVRARTSCERPPFATGSTGNRPRRTHRYQPAATATPGAVAEPVSHDRPAPAPEPRKPTPETIRLFPTPEPLDLATFARRVLEAARNSPTGRFGDNKVFISHVWRNLQDDPAFAEMALPTFKQRLAEANNARLLDLSRADLVEAMDPEDVRLSEVPYLGATFHFVRI